MILIVPNVLWMNRWTLESIGTLELRRSALEDDFEEEEDKEEEDQPMEDVENGTHEKVGKLFYCLFNFF